MTQTAYVITGQRELTQVDVGLSGDPLPRHVVVEIAFCGICGSDVDAYRKGYPYNPTLSGHEWSGRIVSVGAGVDSLAPGDRVARTCQPPCGRCRMCVAGIHERCDNYSLSSLDTAPDHGAYARTIHVPAAGLIKLPDNVSDEQGALVEPATVALHGVRLRQPRLGDTAAILGVGVIGLFAVQLARLAGATHVVAIDPNSERRSAAMELGATHAFAPDDEELQSTVLDLTGQRGADIAYDCAGTGAATIELGVSVLRPGGKFMLIGAPTSSAEVMPAFWLAKEIALETSLAHNRDEFDITVDLMSRSLLKTTGMTSTVIGLGDLPETFERLAERADSLKVLVDPRR